MTSYFLKPVMTMSLAMGFTLLAQGQTSSPVGMNAQLNLQALNRGSDSNVRLFDNRYQGMKGNPYFVNSWLPGSLVLKTDNTGKTEKYSNVLLKFDVYGNHLAAVIPGSKDTVLFSTSPVVSFHLEAPTNSQPILFKRVPEAKAIDTKLADVFFAVLYDGKSQLLKRVNKKKIEANFKGPYSAGQTYDELVDEVQYYVLANGKLERVKLNRKSLLEAIPDKAEKVKSWMTAQKVNIDKEEDVVKVLTFYDSL
ncbi:hypothetical protein [Rufibacter quisquiliarum]|uniref:Uncharacterized protein n=1 Tax=Rufibacter quisquiliarum TaxID=1549639 RepID=A0A839GUC2_9BACT|nr:hypothetical protein [Rufibacter quisquiliarum]MBA9077381.1 hypothetical protein [Rufibacter quisquiliarum]